jgi:hypothetical protein
VYSDASDIQVSVDIASLVSGTIGPFATAYGSSTLAHPTYSASETFLSAAAAGGVTVLGDPTSFLGTGVGLTSGTLSASASGSPHFATASSSVEDLKLGLALAGLSVLSIGGTNSDITSTSTAAASNLGVLTATGSSSIAGLTLDVLGLPIDLSAYANVAVPANTVVPITGIVGLVVTLNKQTVVKTPTTISIQTDAIDIDFTDLHLAGLPLSGVVSGDIIIAQSFAQVPEPALWAEMLLGFGALGGLMRTRRYFKTAV